MFIFVYTVMNINNNAFPVRLGELKAPLQLEACADDRSLHWLILSILRRHVEKNKLLEKSKMKQS